MSDYGQGDLFGDDPKAHARRDDPITSHEAAESLESDVIRASQKAVFSCYDRFGPMYDEEFVQRYTMWHRNFGWPPQSASGLRTRRKELVTKGLMKDSGTKVFPPGKTRRAIVWQISEGSHV